jgi:hypothetical protein
MTESPKRATATSSIARALARVQKSAVTAPPNPDAPVSVQTSAGILLPTAAARRFIDALVDAGTPERVNERYANLKEPLRDVLNWSNPKFSKATKAVARAVGSVLVGTDENGVSTFAQGVELVSFLSMIAPLLEPDRIARIAEHASKTTSAFGPTLYPIGPFGQLRLMLDSYSEVRREELLISLWDSVHDGRWWNHTVGDRKVRRDGTRAIKRRRKVDEEERQAIAGQLRAIMGQEGVCTLDLLTRAIQARTLSFSQDAAELMMRIPEPDKKTKREFLEALAGSDDEDHRVLASYIPFLKPGDRPESPVSTMIALLLTVRGGPAEIDLSAMPKDPDDWSALYPHASLVPFPYDKVFSDIHGQRMPGLPGADIFIIPNADELKKNGEFMGNCTFSYRDRCEQGSHVIGRCTYAGIEYNFSIRRQTQTHWAVGEVNSRFNHGNVPPEVRESVDRLINGVNAILVQATM